MMVYVDSARCTGCGACVEACPTGALGLTGGVATVDQEKCRGCEACMEACPTEAILSVTETESEQAPLPMSMGTASLAPASRTQVSAVGRMRKVWPWLGTALAFVGREVVPRVAVSLLDILDRRGSEETPMTVRCPGPLAQVDWEGHGRHRLRRRRNG